MGGNRFRKAGVLPPDFNGMDRRFRSRALFVSKGGDNINDTFRRENGYIQRAREHRQSRSTRPPGRTMYETSSPHSPSTVQQRKAVRCVRARLPSLRLSTKKNGTLTPNVHLRRRICLHTQ